jgi:hypothetical protein
MSAMRIAALLASVSGRIIQKLSALLFSVDAFFSLDYPPLW